MHMNDNVKWKELIFALLIHITFQSLLTLDDIFYLDIYYARDNSGVDIVY